jgi:regulator of sigma E protease
MLLGIIFIIIFLSVFILIHELGHFLAAKKFGLLVEEFGFGLPPRIWGKKVGETLYSINALPFGGFVKIYGEDPSLLERDKADAIQPKGKGEEKTLSDNRSFASIPVWRRAVIMVAGVFMNFLLGWLLVSIIFNIGIPQAVLIADVVQNSPAAEAGLRIGDKIMGFSGADEFIEHVNERTGENVVLKIERDGKEMEIQAVPRLNPPIGEGALGIAVSEIGLPKQNFFISAWQGLKTSLEIVAKVFVAIFTLIKSVFVGKASLEAITGPVGIVRITAQAGELGFVYVLQLLALISLNLVVINILPFPALDGGRLLFLLIEKIKGSPLPAKFERYANAVGFALLLILMAAITIKDITRFF